MDDYREVIGEALKQKGYSVSTLNKNELNDAIELIKTSWLPNIVKFDAEGFGKDFARGDLWLCHGYAEVIYGEVPKAQWDETIDFFIPEEGGTAYLDTAKGLPSQNPFRILRRRILRCSEARMFL